MGEAVILTECKYLTLPLISALIGWLTNFIAIKMLFHPRQPLRLGLLTLQGIFPKRKPQLARKLGTMVETELFSGADLRQLILTPETIEPLRALVGQRVDALIDDKLVEKVNPMARMFVTEAMLTKLRAKVREEVDTTLTQLLEQFGDSMQERLKIQDIVREKIEAYSMEKVEAMLLSIMRREFRFIEVVGGVLGFLIGVAQLALIYLFG